MGSQQLLGEGDGLEPEVWAELLHLAAMARAVRDSDDNGEQSAHRQQFRDRVATFVAGCGNGDLTSVYLQLIEASARSALTIGQLGQTLDARIATDCGHSRGINGSESLDHLHRLRALVDAVVVGASTVHLDDPQLTTRRVQGANPVRVVIDPRRRLSPAAHVFNGSVPTLVLVADGDADHPAAGKSSVSIARVGGGRDEAGAIHPSDVLACLWAHGLRAVLIEGGAWTVSLFLRHRRLDRLHVTVAPLLLGSGKAAIALPSVGRIDEALRLTMQAHPLGADMLFDCQLV